VKQIALRMHAEGPKRLTLRAEGPGEITAGQIAQVSDIEILNPGLVLCTLDEGVTFRMELTVATGKGYVPADRNRPEDAPIGLMPVDSLFSPVKKVSYKVENTREGQILDYDKLTMTLETNGAVTPENAVAYAARILQDQLQVFINFEEPKERVADETLDKFCRREVFSPLKLNMTYYPQPSLWNAIPPTADATEYRHRRVQGEVNDDNAAAMGGVAAHAGLFADPLSVARFAECLLSGGAPLFQRETVELFTRRQTSPADTPRTLGWDTPSTPSQSGTLFSPRSFGHLGYTGTSLWCDPERHLSVTLLTNRTWPNADSQGIQQLRPALHDAILSRL